MRTKLEKKGNSEHYGQTQIQQHWIKFIKNEQMKNINEEARDDFCA